MRLVWDNTGEKRYETGVDQGVLYKQDVSGDYTNGFAWNGLTGVTESPSGAESNKQYANNTVYLNLLSAEEFGGTIEAFTYPDEFAECDGSASPQAGIAVGQQTRKPFGLCYRTRIGNDLQGVDLGYKLHLVYNATASPSERGYTTINESPEAMTLSWEFSTTPVAVPGHKSSSLITIDSTKVPAGALTTLEDFLYGTAGAAPRLPLPAEVLAIFAGAITQVTPTAPTYNATTDIITIPTVTGVVYKIDGKVVTGNVGPITSSKVVTASPAVGYKFPAVVDDEFLITFS